MTYFTICGTAKDLWSNSMTQYSTVIVESYKYVCMAFSCSHNGYTRHTYSHILTYIHTNSHMHTHRCSLTHTFAYITKIIEKETINWRVLGSWERFAGT